MATTFGLRGANSTCFQQTGGSENLANATLIASQPSGQLLSFLSATYANDAAAETAFRAVGGFVCIRPVSGTDPVAAAFAWKATASVPTFDIAGAAADNVFDIKIAIDHSVTR